MNATLLSFVGLTLVSPLSMPIGSSEAFQATAVAVADALEAGNFAEASSLASGLPKARFRLVWDDAGVPNADRPLFAAARDRAVEKWREFLPQLQVALASVGEVRVTFVPELPPGPDGGGPAGAVFFASDDPADPRIEAVVALRRESARLPILAAHVHNEVAHAIGAYLGLAALPRGGSAMARSDLATAFEFPVSPLEALVARETLRVADTLRSAVAGRARVELARPRAFVDVGRIDLPEAGQGEVLQTSFQVTNRGDGALNFRVVPDCGCFRIAHNPTVAPGQTSLVQVAVDTAEFPGPFDKAVFLYTNDPEAPVRRVAFRTNVRPAYRFLRETEGPVVLDDDGGRVDVVFVTDERRPIRIASASSSGVRAVFEQEHWEGSLADPGLGEPARARTGLRFRFLVAPGELQGRSTLTLTLKTDSELFPTLHYSIPVQRGIVALPAAVNLGRRVERDRPAWFLVSRPGRPFRVLSVTADTDSIQPTFAPFRDGDYRVTLRISREASPGPIAARVTVRTDDPRQPEVVVPVTGVLP